MNFVLENTFNINRIDPEVASKELMRLATKHKALTSGCDLCGVNGLPIFGYGTTPTNSP